MKRSAQATSTTATRADLAASTAQTARSMANKFLGSSTFSVQKLMNQRGALSSMLVVPCASEYPLRGSLNIVITAGCCGSILCFWEPLPNPPAAPSERTSTNDEHQKFMQSKRQDQHCKSNCIYALKHSKLFTPTAAVVVMAHLESGSRQTSDLFVTGMADGTLKVWSALRCVCIQVICVWLNEKPDIFAHIQLFGVTPLLSSSVHLTSSQS